MTTGALIFAINNEEIDYLRMAAWSAENIHRHLDIPVCVVTDASTRGMKMFDRTIEVERYEHHSQRYFEDIGRSVSWYNHNRCDAYLFTPWDQTLVLDADYVVASDQLRMLLDSGNDFLCHRWAYDVTGRSDFSDLNYFGRHNMQMWWATVMMFRKTSRTAQIFDIMNMIKFNWQHYRDLYGIPRSNYRNDHALTIALNIINGHALRDSHHDLPWALASVTPEHAVTQIAEDHYRVDFNTVDARPRYIEISKQDFHAMGKRHLGDIIANQS